MAATIIVLETVQELECGRVTWNGSVHNIVYDLLVTHSLSPGPGLGCTSPANASRTITIQNRAITNSTVWLKSPSRGRVTGSAPSERDMIELRRGRGAVH